MYKMSPCEEAGFLREMKLFQGFLPMLSLLSSFLISVLVHAQDDQIGFISIDCGIGEGETYTDDVTKIKYVSDATFKDSGETHEILSEYQSNVDKQLWKLVSFPNNTRNCYTLKPTQGKGNRYLIRARFMYGNYDSMQGKLPKFDVHLGTDYWDTVRLKSPSEPIDLEIIHVLASNYIQVCLVNTDYGTPFISALELRLLPVDMYNQTKHGSLYLFRRLSFTKHPIPVRYIDDKYDRLWSPFNFTESTGTDSYGAPPVKINTNFFNLPSEVMRFCISLSEGSDYSNQLLIHLDPDTTAYHFYMYIHFAEIIKLDEGQKREFNISVNEQVLWEAYSPIFNTTESRFIYLEPSPIYNLLLQTTPDSDFPAILNALEFYRIMVLPQQQIYDQDVAAMWSIKSTYGVTKNWQGDPCTPQEFVWEGIRCSYNETESSRIILLNLSTSGLIGEIDFGLANLTMVQTLDLSNNNLTGTVPDFLSGLKFLTKLNLKGNSFTGAIPSGLIEKAKKGTLLLSFDGENTGHPCDRNSCKNKKDNKVIVSSIAVGSVVAFFIALTVAWKIIKKKQRDSNVLHTGKGIELEIRKKQYTYSDIRNITNNFSVVLGRGASGKVYHGIIGDTVVAVKMLSESSEHGEKQFRAEATLLLSVHHKNLISLVGYCNDESHKGIIYEYMANGNLESLLLDNNSSVLNWEERLQIGCDAAQGLEYLHHGCKTPIVHRDVKCHNILLNEASHAKLGDFGLSREFLVDNSHISTKVFGTHGYLDPEYHTSSQLTTKSDVYSFGVVLLVLVTGQPAIIKKVYEPLHIIRIVSVKLGTGDMNNIVDPTLREDFDVSSAWKVVELAMACVSPTSNKRPTMKEVVIELNYCLLAERARKEKKRNQDITGSMSLDLAIAHDPTPR